MTIDETNNEKHSEMLAYWMVEVLLVLISTFLVGTNLIGLSFCLLLSIGLTCDKSMVGSEDQQNILFENK